MAVTDRRYNKQEDNMEELNFEVQTDLAPIREMTVASNSGEVLAAVRELVAPYKNLVVTPETRKAAKDDLACLRRLRKQIDEQRKAVDAVFAAPAKLFKSERVDPILREIDEAINPIDAQVKAQEEAERQEELATLREFFDAENEKAYNVVEWDKIAARHPEWKNKGCTEEKAKSDILTEFAGIERDLQAIHSPAYEQYRAMMIEKYCERYNLADAINVYTQIKRREAMEAERKKRKEEEARAAAERRLMEAEAERQRRQNASETTQAINREFTRAETETSTAAEDGGDAPIQTVPAVKRVEFWVEVTSEQAKALGRFLRENGIMYGAVKR